LAAVNATDANPHPESNDHPDVAPDAESAAGTPRWITVLGIVIGVLVLLMFVVLHLTGVMGSGSH
jgi:hypothetical protein